MQTLTIKKAKAAARKAYREKRLTAQHPKQHERQCVYSSGKYGCAVGVGLNEATLKALAGGNRNNSPVKALLENQRLAASDGDHSAIAQLQRLHDDWCNFSRNYGAKRAEAVKARKNFLEFIGL